MPTFNIHLHTLQRCCLILLAIWLFQSVSEAQLPLEPKTVLPRAEIVWPDISDGTYHIFYSALNDKKIWSSKIQVSSSNVLNLAPTISSDRRGNTWVVWSAVEGVGSKLKYSHFDGDTWSSPTEIPSHLSANTGPSILIDNDDIPWVVWSGFDGSDDDIYYSKWNGNGWDAPAKLHADNSVPDLLPRIAMSTENNLSVYWDGFDGDSYQKYISMWNGNSWSVKQLMDRQVYRTTLQNEIQQLPRLPEFINEPEKASIHIRLKEKFQSISLRELGSN